MVAGVGTGAVIHHGERQYKRVAENYRCHCYLCHYIPVGLELHCHNGDSIYRNEPGKFQKADDFHDDLDILLCHCIFYIYRQGLCHPSIGDMPDDSAAAAV